MKSTPPPFRESTNQPTDPTSPKLTTTPNCQALNHALGEVDASAAAMHSLGAAMTAGAGQQEMDPGDCEVQ